MSYDLFFYKRKTSALDKAAIANYLNINLTQANEHSNQWFFENKDTEVYFSFEADEPSEDPDDIEFFENFAEFDNTGFSFNLNFMRPSFFGLEAFQFVEKFITDLELFVLNPQFDMENPYLPFKGDLFENWNITNLNASRDHFNSNACYYPLAESNKVWKHNFNRQRLQAEVGKEYFVAKIFFFEKLDTNQVITLCIWPTHVAAILPKTDYYLIGQQYKTFFKTVDKKPVITRQVFLETFGSYFEDYPFDHCKIIKPKKAIKVASIFNKLKSELSFEISVGRISVDYLYNAKP